MMKRLFDIRFCAPLAMLVASAFACFADESADSAAVADIPRLPEISLLTIGPGEQIYQLEGHTALRFNFSRHDDMTVNWGTFDFNTPNFVYRFVSGQTDYSIGLAPMNLLMIEYAMQQRQVVEQILNLTDREKIELTRLVNENLKPENQVYRYNYVLDNCATRPLAMIEKALAVDSATLRIDMPEPQTTFREEMRRYHSNFPLYQFGIDLALGSGIDRPISLREKGFAPVFLQEMMENAVIVGADGSEHPLVARQTTLLQQTMSEPRESNGWAIAIYILLLVSALAVGIYDLVKRRQTKWYYALFYLLTGLAGVIIAFLVFISVHEATSPNVNLLWLNPLALIVPIGIWWRAGRRAVLLYQYINLSLLAVYLIGALWFAQSLNILFIPLAVADMLLAIAYIRTAKE